MDQAARIAALARAATLLATSDDVELQAIGGDLTAWLAGGKGQGLETALRIATPQGGQSWRTRAKLAERDAALRDAARRFDLTAVDLARKLTRYRAAGWTRDCTAQTCPDRLLGTLSECLWHVLRHRDRDLSERQIRDIIGGEQAVLTADEVCDTDSRKEHR